MDDSAVVRKPHSTTPLSSSDATCETATENLKPTQTFRTNLWALGVVFAGLCLIYFASLSSLWSIWGTQNHRHGYLVMLISAWLFWGKRGILADADCSGSLIGLFTLACLIWIWIVARLSLILFVEHLAVILMFSATAYSVLGWRTFRQVAFPCLFLLFALPLGDWLIPILMDFTADVSAMCLHALGIPVFRQENIMTLPGGSFEVADVCAGFAHLTTGLTIGALYAYLNYRRTSARIIAVVALVTVLVVENGIRAFVVMAVASATNMRYFTGFDHIVFGWILFAVTMLAMGWFGQKFSKSEPTSAI